MMQHKTRHDSETPAHGQQVMVACAFIHRGFELLAGKPLCFS